MERKNKACWNCYYYSAYYTKGYYSFQKKRFGCCNYTRQETNCQDACQHWKDNVQKEQTRRSSALRALLQICEDLAVVKQVLADEDEFPSENG